MAQLTGRLLPPPGIQYTQGKEVAISQQNPGKWVQRSQDMMYVSGSTLQYWAVLDLGGRERLSDNEYQSIVKGLLSVAEGVGLKIKSSDDNLMYKPSSEQMLEKDFADLVAEFDQARTRLEMVIVVMQFKGSRAYDVVKHLGDIKYKIPTQCCVKRNLFKPGGQVNM